MTYIARPYKSIFHLRYAFCTWQGAASVIQTDALGDSQEIAHLDMGHYFGEVRSKQPYRS